MNRICPVCGNLKSDFIQQIHMTLPREMPLPNQYDIVSCQRCGFCYADTSAAQSDYDRYYSAYNDYSGQGENDTFTVRIPPFLAFLNDKLSLEASLLDIGFGNGQLLKQLHSLGYANLFGIDPSVHSVAHLRKSGISAYQKSVYDAADELEGTMDAVFLTAIAEHLLNPKAAICSAAAYLKMGGYLIVEVPDYSYSDKVELPLPSLFNQEHINYFSENSFITMLGGTDLAFLYSVQVTIPTGDGMGNEYVKAFFLQKLPDGEIVPSAIRKDDQTRRAIMTYLKAWGSKQEEMRTTIHTLCERQAPIIIWGTGAMTMSLLADTDLKQCNIVAFTDSNPLKQGRKLGEKKIVSPQKVKDYPDAVILISAMQYAAEIQNIISSMKLPNQIVVLTN